MIKGRDRSGINDFRLFALLSRYVSSQGESYKTEIYHTIINVDRRHIRVISNSMENRNDRILDLNWDV